MESDTGPTTAIAIVAHQTRPLTKWAVEGPLKKGQNDASCPWC